MTCPCAKYHAGMLTQKVTIERVTRTRDAAGGWTESWAADPLDGMYAHLEYLTGTERWEAQRVHPGNLMRAVIHYRGTADGLPYYSASDRLIWRTREFAILAVHDLEFKQMWLQLDLLEGRAT